MMSLASAYMAESLFVAVSVDGWIAHGPRCAAPKTLGMGRVRHDRFRWDGAVRWSGMTTTTQDEFLPRPAGGRRATLACVYLVAITAIPSGFVFVGIAVTPASELLSGSDCSCLLAFHHDPGNGKRPERGPFCCGTFHDQCCVQLRVRLSWCLVPR